MQWLKLGAASAGMGAALLGFSLMGPSAGTAAADSTTKSSASAPSDSDASSDSGSSDADSTTGREGTEPDDGDDHTADTDADTDTDTADADADAARGDMEDAEPDVEEDRVQPRKSVRLATSPAAEPAEEEEQQPPAPPVNAPEWLAPRRTANENVARIVDTWTDRNQAWINSLNVSAARKAELAEDFVQFKRTFLNQAPTLKPVQLTGLSSGDITGKIEAADADGDRITYRLVSGPKQGSVVINEDGTYIYTPGARFDGVDTFRVVALDAGSNVNLLNPLRGVGASAVGLINQNAIRFEFNYDGADWTPERRQALEEVAASLVEYFRVDRPVTLTYDANIDSDPKNLASAGSPNISTAAGYWNTVVQRKLLTGRDANGNEADGEISWNWSNYTWALGSDVAPGQFDFVSTALHELMHSFGFLSSVNEAGKNTNQNRRTFDRYMVTATGARPFRGAQWLTSNDPKLTAGDGGLYFGGPNAVLANDGFLIPLYTPWEWDEGSSVSHLDDLTFVGANEKMMNSKTESGPGRRVFSAMELGILRDIGYTVVMPVTPPYSGAALIGFVLLLRKRRK